MNRRGFLGLSAAAAALPAATVPAAADADCRAVASGGLALIIERASGSALIAERMTRGVRARVTGLGDLSHASAVYSPDERFAYVFGRDGGLTKIDMLSGGIADRIMQAGNSIGGAISDDGRLVAVSNYEPGGVRVFDARSLELVADIPAGSKTVGLVDAPGRRFVFSLWDRAETWVADFSAAGAPAITRITGVGDRPYDGLITGDGRYYVAGLFGEDHLSLIDLWSEPLRARPILPGYAEREETLPVYKMPHLEGWASTGEGFVLPAVGLHEVLWVDGRGFKPLGSTATHGQPVFAMARPDGRQVWVNFAHPLNDVVQVIDTPSREVIHSIETGPATLHMEFAPRGHEVWISVRDENRVKIYDTRTFAQLGEIEAESPSGIFFTARAHRIGL